MLYKNDASEEDAEMFEEVKAQFREGSEPGDSFFFDFSRYA